MVLRVSVSGFLLGTLDAWLQVAVLVNVVVVVFVVVVVGVVVVVAVAVCTRPD